MTVKGDRVPCWVDGNVLKLTLGMDAKLCDN